MLKAWTITLKKDKMEEEARKGDPKEEKKNGKRSSEKKRRDSVWCQNPLIGKEMLFFHDPFASEYWTQRKQVKSIRSILNLHTYTQGQQNQGCVEWKPSIYTLDLDHMK